MPMVGERKFLVSLRRMCGMTIEQLAQRATLGMDVVIGLERGTQSEGFDQLLAFYNLDAELLREADRVALQAGAPSVFFFQGPQQDFHFTDLETFSTAMTWGRQMAIRSPAALEQRLSFAPVNPAGPLPRDAARQGHALARVVRRRLNLGHEPLPDVRALLEQRLGVAVLRLALRSSNLRAAAILDTARASATAIVNGSDEYVRWNHLVLRVYLAHELCHLLFDATDSAVVRLSMDDHESGGVRGDLLEARAKGFAAELLLPREGVAAHLGAATGSTSTIVAAEKMVRAAAKVFGTPLEIATNHLCNLGYFDGDTRQALIGSKPAGSGDARAAHRTTLPEVGHPPLGLAEPEQDPRSGTDQELLAYYKRARDASQQQAEAIREGNRARCSTLLAEVTDLARRVDARTATNHLAERLDAALLEADFNLACSVLEAIPTDELPPIALTGALTATRAARDELGESRLALLARVKRSLAATHGWSDERIEAMAARLA